MYVVISRNSVEFHAIAYSNITLYYNNYSQLLPPTTSYTPHTLTPHHPSPPTEPCNSSIGRWLLHSQRDWYTRYRPWPLGAEHHSDRVCTEQHWQYSPHHGVWACVWMCGRVCGWVGVCVDVGACVTYIWLLFMQSEYEDVPVDGGMSSIQWVHTHTPSTPPTPTHHTHTHTHTGLWAHWEGVGCWMLSWDMTGTPRENVPIHHSTPPHSHLSTPQRGRRLTWAGEARVLVCVGVGKWGTHVYNYQSVLIIYILYYPKFQLFW